MQSFGTMVPVTVNAANLVQMRLISHRSNLRYFETFIFLAEFQYAYFTQRLLTIELKTAKNVFFQSCLFKKQIQV